MCYTVPSQCCLHIISQILIYFIFIFIQPKILPSFLFGFFSLIHRLVRSVLFNFLIFMRFPRYFLALVHNIIPLSSFRIFLDLLILALCPRHTFFLRSTNYKMVGQALDDGAAPLLSDTDIAGQGPPKQKNCASQFRNTASCL